MTCLGDLRLATYLYRAYKPINHGHPSTWVLLWEIGSCFAWKGWAFAYTVRLSSSHGSILNLMFVVLFIGIVMISRQQVFCQCQYNTMLMMVCVFKLFSSSTSINSNIIIINNNNNNIIINNNNIISSLFFSPSPPKNYHHKSGEYINPFGPPSPPTQPPRPKAPWKK